MNAVITLPLLCILFGCAASRPAGPFDDFFRGVGNIAGSFVRTAEDSVAAVLSDQRVQRAADFAYQFFTNNGIFQQARGDERGNIEGSYGWQSADGSVLQTKYRADEKGNHAAYRLLGISCTLEASLCGTQIG